MDLQTAIERAKSALEARIEAAEAIPDWLRTDGIGRSIRLDTEALQALREWKPEEKAQSTASNADPLRDCCQHGAPLDNPCFDCDALT